MCALQLKSTKTSKSITLNSKPNSTKICALQLKSTKTNQNAHCNPNQQNQQTNNKKKHVCTVRAATQISKINIYIKCALEPKSTTKKRRALQPKSEKSITKYKNVRTATQISKISNNKKYARCHLNQQQN